MTDKYTVTDGWSEWCETIHNSEAETITIPCVFEPIEKDDVYSFQLIVDPDDKEKWLSGEIDKIAVIGTVTRSKE